jgi:hypothetical protein
MDMTASLTVIATQTPRLPVPRYNTDPEQGRQGTGRRRTTTAMTTSLAAV